jgi:arsenate reductase (glutaredoxin)
MIRVFGWGDSRVCLRAQNWMNDRQINYRIYYLNQHPVDINLLDAWLDAFGWRNLIDKRTAAWRHRPFELSIEHDRFAVRELLLNRPIMLKMPIIEAGNCWLLGWNAPNKVRLLGHLQDNHAIPGQYEINPVVPAPVM